MLICALYVCPSFADSVALDILPLADVRPGMEGEARTVFQGTTPESFKIRVISILRNYLPHQDIVLIEAVDPRVQHTGIAAGMSGSPVYVKGKLLGAIAYGFSSAKDPLAGVTPIEAMLSQADRPGKPDSYVKAMETKPSLTPPSKLPLMLPVAVPLAISGMSEPVLRYLHEDLATNHLVPMRGGGGGKGRISKAALVPGAAVGVSLVRGDLTATAVGTLTCVDGNQVHAFGHPLFGAGQVSLPLVLAKVHAIIPSLVSSIKLASPLGEVGQVTDDLKNGIIGVLSSERARMVPLKVQLTSNKQVLRPFSVEIVRHRRLLPTLATAVLSTALTEAFPDLTDAVADVTTRISIPGLEPILLRDQFAASEGFVPRTLAMAHGPRVLSELLGNPFAPVEINRIDVMVSLTHRADVVEIVGLASPGDRIRAGHPLPLRVTLRPYGGKEFVRILTVNLPVGLAGRTVKIEVASGTLVKPQVARPENLQGFVDNLRAFHQASSIVVSMAHGEMGADLRGKVLLNLPSSAIDLLRPSQSVRHANVFKVVEQTPFPSTHVVTGKMELTLHVLPQEKTGE